MRLANLIPVVRQCHLKATSDGEHPSAKKLVGRNLYTAMKRLLARALAPTTGFRRSKGGFAAESNWSARSAPEGLSTLFLFALGMRVEYHILQGEFTRGGGTQWRHPRATDLSLKLRAHRDLFQISSVCS
jgi:hypothetical protein